ncbi:hypothetical protein FOZ63_030783, partial [Perkinsus olseni]
SYKLFVDNCCIPQDDPVLKEVGIRSLGSYLIRSSSIIVMWSKCYFDRLWCVYELAAFLSLRAGALNGERRPAERGSPVVEELRRVGRGIKEWMVGSSYRDQVVFTSLPLIKFVFAFTLVGFVGNILLSLEVAVVGSFKASLKARLICAIPEGLLLAAVLCPFASRYVRDRDALVNQIMTFQMENTKCTVEADREFVTGRISAMYDGDLTTFERVVKSEVGRAARQTLGIRRGTIPFKYVSLELVSEGHPYTLVPLCLIHSVICVALYFPVFPRESRGCLSRFIDLIFPVDVDVEDLNSSSVRVKVGGVADLGGGWKSLPSLRRVELGAVPKVYHARSWWARGGDGDGQNTLHVGVIRVDGGLETCAGVLGQSTTIVITQAKADTEPDKVRQGAENDTQNVLPSPWVPWAAHLTATALSDKVVCNLVRKLMDTSAEGLLKDLSPAASELEMTLSAWMAAKAGTMGREGEAIRTFKGAFSFLSNFSDDPVRMDDGILYPTAEHAFQAQKILDVEKRRSMVEKCKTAKSVIE